MTVSSFAVAPSASDFLNVTLEILWHGEMQDGPQIGFVQAHSKRHRCYHDPEITLRHPNERRWEIQFVAFCMLTGEYDSISDHASSKSPIFVTIAHSQVFMRKHKLG